MLRRIELHRVYDVHEVAAALDAIASRWTADRDGPVAAANDVRARGAQPAELASDDDRPGFVIVDSTSAAIAPVYGRPLQRNKGAFALLLG